MTIKIDDEMPMILLMMTLVVMIFLVLVLLVMIVTASGEMTSAHSYCDMMGLNFKQTKVGNCEQFFKCYCMCYLGKILK